MTDAANEKQIEFWNTTTGARWVQMQDVLDAQLEPYGRAALEAAQIANGERVLDVGCGCGATSLELAKLVGTRGLVTGVDVSEPMLERARARAKEAGLDNVAFQRGDAQVHAFAPGAFDVIFSRFGIMFFDDPPTAFRNLRRALAASGRLAFVCWQSAPQNPWMSVPTMIAMQHVTVEVPLDPSAPGPFAFADAGRVTGILEAAGFEGVRAHDLRREFTMAGGVDGALDLVLKLGPIGRPLADAPPETRRTVEEAVKAALRPFERDGAVRMPSACWVFTAHAPQRR